MAPTNERLEKLKRDLSNSQLDDLNYYSVFVEAKKRLSEELEEISVEVKTIQTELEAKQTELKEKQKTIQTELEAKQTELKEKQTELGTKQTELDANQRELDSEKLVNRGRIEEAIKLEKAKLAREIERKKRGDQIGGISKFKKSRRINKKRRNTRKAFSFL
jgi:DNA repair exonuclease SbcCD ATPase subunit